jgi:hypothetical protein
MDEVGEAWHGRGEWGGDGIRQPRAEDEVFESSKETEAGTLSGYCEGGVGRGGEVECDPVTLPFIDLHHSGWGAPLADNGVGEDNGITCRNATSSRLVNAPL